MMHGDRSNGNVYDNGCSAHFILEVYLTALRLRKDTYGGVL